MVRDAMANAQFWENNQYAQVYARRKKASGADAALSNLDDIRAYFAWMEDRWAELLEDRNFRGITAPITSDDVLRWLERHR
jgi:hypothetical protein